MAVYHSVVKWFDAKKGYGFINHPEGGTDIFVHYSQIITDDRFKTLRTGQPVVFDLNDGPKGLHAHNVMAAEEEAPSVLAFAASESNAHSASEAYQPES
jgi:CspA family cold shock protein